MDAVSSACSLVTLTDTDVRRRTDIDQSRWRVSVAGETLLIAGSVAGLLPLDPQALHSVFLVGDDLSGKR
jgi:hypothetical protein